MGLAPAVNTAATPGLDKHRAIGLGFIRCLLRRSVSLGPGFFHDPCPLGEFAAQKVLSLGCAAAHDLKASRGQLGLEVALALVREPVSNRSHL